MFWVLVCHDLIEDICDESWLSRRACCISSNSLHGYRCKWSWRFI